MEKYGQFPTPFFLVQEKQIAKNLNILKEVERLSGATIILALKAFSMPSVMPLIAKNLSGAEASSINEARLAANFFNEVHVFSPGYTGTQIVELKNYASHIVFNSLSQWERFRPYLSRKINAKKISAGLRLNPEHSEVDMKIYDPCAPFSRLGITADNLRGKDLAGISGLHFHALCESGADALERMLCAFEKKFGSHLKGLEWLNFGGGHHVTRADYDINLLVQLIKHFHQSYGVKIYLEPGEAIALDAGILVASVVDIIENGMPIAILDSSVITHISDIIDAPFRPDIIGAGLPGQLPHTYRLGGISCIAADFFGDFSFPEPLKIGDWITFENMAIYSMVKTSFFNGLNPPDIYREDIEGRIHLEKKFGYHDFVSKI